MVVDTSFLTPESKSYLLISPRNGETAPPSIQVLRNRPLVHMADHIAKPDVTMEKIQIPTYTDSHPVEIDVFRPSNTPNNAKLPALIYLHGGGWTIAADHGHAFLSSKLASEANCAVFLVHFSLSPEVKFPVALEECYSVLTHLTDPELAEKYNVDPTKVAVGGDSAGGNLATVLALMAKQRQDLKNTIKYQVLYYPVTGYDFETESYNRFKVGYHLTKEVMQILFNSYFNELAEGNVLAIPGLATTEELSGLPPALIITAQADVLCCDGENYAHQLLKANVPVTSLRVNGVIHGFMTSPFLHSPETVSVIDMTTAALRRAFTAVPEKK